MKKAVKLLGFTAMVILMSLNLTLSSDSAVGDDVSITALQEANAQEFTGTCSSGNSGQCFTLHFEHFFGMTICTCRYSGRPADYCSSIVTSMCNAGQNF